MNRLDTYTISFSNVLTAERSEYSGLPGIDLRFFQGRGAELLRHTIDPNAANPFESETRSTLVVGFLVDDATQAVAHANEIARRCADP
jgi:hypothetical protein